MFVAGSTLVDMTELGDADVKLEHGVTTTSVDV
jgi:hypothetical protein